MFELIRAGQIGFSAADTASLGMFGFLYGSLPTAPTVFVYSSLFNIATSQVCCKSHICQKCWLEVVTTNEPPP